jgi:hypothetical protein
MDVVVACPLSRRLPATSLVVRKPRVIDEESGGCISHIDIIEVGLTQDVKFAAGTKKPARPLITEKRPMKEEPLSYAFIVVI